MSLFDKSPSVKNTTNLESAKREIEKFHRLVAINGSWNASEYMLGQYNALEYVVSILNNREPEFRSLNDHPEVNNDPNRK